MIQDFSSKAWSPANISLVFTIEQEKLPSKSGSKGIGFTVNEGVSATVTPARRGLANQKYSIFFNGQEVVFPTVADVLELLKSPSVSVDLRSNLPLGCGFGLSGASALSTAYATNELTKKHVDTRQLALFAHIAEVENKTGLGDVVNQYYGGCCLRVKSSAHFEVEHLPFEKKSVYYRIVGSLSTAAVLANNGIKQRINTAGNNVLASVRPKIITNKLAFADILDSGYLFARESQLLTDTQVTSTIDTIRAHGGHATMIMLGKSVVADIPFTGSKHLSISNTPAHLL